LKGKITTFHCRSNTPNPISYEVSSLEDLDRKICLAQEVYESKLWDNPLVRRSFFEHLTLQLIDRQADLMAIYCRESSLTEERFLREFSRMLHQIKVYEREGALRIEPLAAQSFNDRTLIKRLLPLGPIAVFGASNFPLAYGTLGGDTIGALASGCPVIVKGHPLHAGTSAFLAEIAEETLKCLGLPRGIFGHVLDDGFELGQKLIQDPRILGGAFTGSLVGGMSLFQLANQRKNPIPFFAEMGSLNPVIILDNVPNLEEQVNCLASAITEDAGQFCTKPGIILVPKEMFLKAQELLVQHFTAIPSHPMLHPSIYERYVSRLKEIEQHLTVNRFGEPIPWHGLSALVSLSLAEFLNLEPLHHEVFGPFTCLLSYEEPSQLKDLFRCIGGQLTVSFMGLNPENEPLWEFAQQYAGRMIVNGVPTGVLVERNMHHGGPFPSSTDARFSSVGEASLFRFLRPISVQKNY
jgi:NADP-dependent aldehyde dehydrogenase